MPSTFSQAFGAITKASSSVYESLRERILPTPGKRKREKEIEVPLGSDRVKRLMKDKASTDDEEGSVHPDSQFAHAGAPPADLSEVTKDPNQGQQAKGVDHLTFGATVDAARQTPVISVPQQNPAGQHSTGRLKSMAPWQRRYPMIRQSRLSLKDSMAIPTSLQISPFKRSSRQWMVPRSPTLFGKSHLKANKKYADSLHVRRQDLKERDILRQMTSQWEAERPRRATNRAKQKGSDVVIDLESQPSEGQRPFTFHNQSRLQPFTTQPSLQHQQKQSEPLPDILSWLREPLSELNPSLAAAEFQLDRSKRQQEADLQLEQRKEALARVTDLIGTQQTALLARASQLLGEKLGKQQLRNAAAEISKASMQLARTEAQALARPGSEIEILEQQQRRLRELREARQAAHRIAQSSQKPAKKLEEARPAEAKPPLAVSVKPKARKEPEEAVIDLLSSDDEAEAPDEEDEAATLHGEISPRDASEEEVSYSDEDVSEEEDEEEELRSKLLDVSVTEEPPPGFPPLTKQQLSQHRDALNSRADQAVELKMHKSTNIGVNRGLLACLRSREWLNDEVMNIFIGLLQDRDKRWRASGKHPKCHFWSTFFFNKMCLDDREYSYKAVSRWTRPQRLQKCGQESATILDCDRIIAPIHLGVHWTCAMADITNKEFAYFDSMGGANKLVMESFQRYIADEYKDKKQQEVDTSQWKIRYNPGSVPVQTNGCDCGVFALTFAEHLSRTASLSFSQDHMEYFRKMIAAAIMDLKLPA